VRQIKEQRKVGKMVCAIHVATLAQQKVTLAIQEVKICKLSSYHKCKLNIQFILS